MTRMNTLRTILSLAVAGDLGVQQINIRTACLNAEVEEEVYMEQPEGYVQKSNLVCRLLKAIYELKQASRAWFNRLSKYLIFF